MGSLVTIIALKALNWIFSSPEASEALPEAATQELSSGTVWQSDADLEADFTAASAFFEGIERQAEGTPFRSFGSAGSSGRVVRWRPGLAFGMTPEELRARVARMNTTPNNDLSETEDEFTDAVSNDGENADLIVTVFEEGDLEQIQAYQNQRCNELNGHS